MKKILNLPLIFLFAVSIQADARGLSKTDPAFRSLNVKPFEKETTVFSSAQRTISGLTKLQLGKKIRVCIITQGVNAKIKISKGIYPECYPARFSMKLYYSF